MKSTSGQQYPSTQDESPLSISQVLASLEEVSAELFRSDRDAHTGAAKLLRMIIHYLRYEQACFRLSLGGFEERRECLYELCFAGLIHWNRAVNEIRRAVDLESLVHRVIAICDTVLSGDDMSCETKDVASDVKARLVDELKAWNVRQRPQCDTGHAATPPVSPCVHDGDSSTQGISSASLSCGVDGRKVVLAVATEWNSRHGGLSTFNRELCLALSRHGARVYCYVAKAGYDEVSSAAKAGVTVLIAPDDCGMSEYESLFRRPPLPQDIQPSAVIGHDRQTGRMAAALSIDHFQRSKLIFFVHTAPGEIEPLKESTREVSASETAERRQQVQTELARRANLVVAVGPRLTREIGNLMHSVEREKRVIMCCPGIPAFDISPSVPPALQILLLGRAEDYALKGLGIAARALGVFHEKHVADISGSVFLMVRGAPKGTGDSLRKQLLRDARCDGVDVRVLEYTDSATRLGEDILRSSVVLMPSKKEGFGLVGLEAIGAGIPVLITDQSGLAEMLREKVPDLARHCIVPVVDSVEADSAAWAKNLWMVLKDREAAFQRAARLRAQMQSCVSWDATAEQLLGLIGS